MVKKENLIVFIVVLILISFLLFTFFYPGINAVAKKVSIIYGERNPQIVRIIKTTDDATRMPMYIVTLKGNFCKGNVKAPNLIFSMTAFGLKKQVWSIRLYNAQSKNNIIEENKNLYFNPF
ncbi:hypothetical protein [Caldanaerobius polysaccharolyticus]|uniref:hypothetical protein n=1 Tax=Caldanaerobius polysaccharolyticus TaxID=44256 RepID=UPI00047E5881|nr:hypothetical protein [Caldanaerobius polysaccharolyticus]